MMITYIFQLDFDSFRIVVVAVTGYLNLRLLYNVSLPLSLVRKILLIFCSISFYILLLIFDDFFLIKSYNLLSFVFIVLFILANNYITLFLEEIYDKIVLWIGKIKRRKMVSEKE